MMSNNNYKYKISVIMPVYNVEEYLEETIQSVIKQTIGFKKNIQMILVNDGSPDNSEEICLKYKELYPNNIIYVKQDNSGVSAARNNGIKYVEGKYVNFLDSDDKWSTDSYKIMYNFFEKNYDKIDLVAGRMKFFEASNKYHPLDYTYKKNFNIVNIFDDPSLIHLHITSSLIKSDIAKKHKFDTKLKYGEDAKYVSEIIIDSGKYALIKKATHYYRKRMNNSSAIQTKEKNIEWYTTTLDYYYKFLIDYSLKIYNKIIDYVQYVIMYDLQFRIKVDVTNSISNDELTEYVEKIKELLNKINNNIIFDQKHMTYDYKKYAYRLKTGKILDDILEYSEGKFYFNDTEIHNTVNDNVLSINILKIENNALKIYGQINSILEENTYDIYLSVNGKLSKIILNDSNKNLRNSITGTIYTNKIFNVNIPLKFGNDIQFLLKYKNYESLVLKPSFKIMTKLSTNYNYYYTEGNYKITYKNQKIKVLKNKKISNFKDSIKIIFKLLKNKKYKQLIYRVIYYILRIFKRKEIWLISDRTSVANDNGMHLFKYVNKINEKNMISYFVINKSSPDYKKMKEYGRVVAYNSFKYKMLFLLSDKVISSQADYWVYNAFGKSERYYHDLYNFKFCFLQHGITKDDISDWLNIYNKDISMFVTAASDEYNSILNGNYYYDKSIVKLTGFPRYDNLNDKSEKLIAIMPTWRQYLSGRVNRTSGTREYNPDFINSDYFNFYNNLINDKKLLKCMKKNKYKGIFVVHPSHMENYIDFQKNDVFDVVEGFADYQKIFSESSLLVSDYSSVPFDFAYMRKPVLYTQFDKEIFFGNHLYNEGYFSYEKNGFGPVLYDYNSTIDAIIKYIENDCKLENKYESRIEKFYAFNDKNNCKRVYEEIKKLNEKV